MFGNVTRSRPYSPPKPSGGTLGPTPTTDLDRTNNRNTGLASLTKFLPKAKGTGALTGLFPKRT